MMVMKVVQLLLTLVIMMVVMELFFFFLHVNVDTPITVELILLQGCMGSEVTDN